MHIIKVPLHHTAELAGSDVIGRLHITDDIAEQIVAATKLPGKFAAHEANTLQRLASLEQHVNTLVLSADADTAWKNNAETKMRNVAGLVESTAALLLRVRALEGNVIPRHGDGTPISYQTQAAIQRGMEDSIAGRVTTRNYAAYADDKLEGDDAAVDSMYNIMRDGTNAGEYVNNLHMREFAGCVIAAIRRGEVPGITTTDQHLEPWKEVAELRANLAQLEKDKSDAAGELRVDISDCKPGTLAGKLLSANVILRHSNSDLLSRAAVLMAERDDISAKLSDANACIRLREADARKLANECDRLEPERDNALNDVAVLRGTLNAMNTQMKDLSARHDKCFSDLAACRSALRDIASTVGGTVGEKCSNEFHCLVRGEVQIVVDKLRADLAAMKEQNVRLNAQVEVLLSKDGREQDIIPAKPIHIARLKLSAERNGWVRTAGTDLCPSCHGMQPNASDHRAYAQGESK